MSDPRNYSATRAVSRLSRSNDRRRACRYLVALPESSLGWWEESSFVDTPCRTIDISLIGCMVESRPLPRRMARQSVWFRTLGVSPSDWTEGIIVAIRKPLFRKWQIRISFLAPFPYESFRSLVFGPDQLGETARRESLEHETDHFWK
jgi:hypothetical protein